VATEWTPHDQRCTDFWHCRVAAPWQRHWRRRLAAIVLIFVAVVGTRDEPSFTATATEFLTYYHAPDTVATPFRSFLFTVGLVTFVWFVLGLSILLRRAEGEAAWRVGNRDGLPCALRGPRPVRDRERGRCRVPRRWPAIEVLITHRVTNARTEAANTGIKHIKRTRPGY
jgi:hypothetical protein